MPRAGGRGSGAQASSIQEKEASPQTPRAEDWGEGPEELSAAQWAFVCMMAESGDARAVGQSLGLGVAQCRAWAELPAVQRAVRQRQRAIAVVEGASLALATLRAQATGTDARAALAAAKELMDVAGAAARETQEEGVTVHLCYGPGAPAKRKNGKARKGEAPREAGTC